MKSRIRLSLIAAAGLLFAVASATGQGLTTGSVRGVVEDQANGEPVIGATVVATGPKLQGTQAQITDETGSYRISNLPPGTYQLTVYYSDAQFARPNVLIRLGKTAKVNIDINTEAAAGEVIEIEGRAPLLDQDSTKTGVSITNDYTENIPTGRTFGAVLGPAAGSDGDTYGTSFSGSTSPENQFVVDGLNTTDPAFGGQSTNLPNEFIQETEVITGGYNAEYGRSTGGIINVITKQGSNEFHGSVFAYYTPGQLVASADRTFEQGSAIDGVDNLGFSADVGAEIGGPIVKDKLWFHAGFNPSFNQTNVSRIIKSQVDENSDGVPDVDENGFTIYNDVDTDRLTELDQQYFWTGKLSGAVNPDHQGQLSLLGSPSYGETYTTLTGPQSAGLFDVNNNVFDTSAKWTSKFNDNKTQIDVVAGYHMEDRDLGIGAEGGDAHEVLYEPTAPLTRYSDFESEFGGVPGACQDGGGSDPYPMITNCPVRNYVTGGLGGIGDRTTTRLVGTASVTQRVKAAGHHTFKGGVDVEQQGYDAHRKYTGDTGTIYTREANAWELRRLYTPGEGGVPCGADINGDGIPESECVALGSDELTAETNTRNLAAYVQDSWSVLPNLTVNAGLRWEQQTLFIADDLQGQPSPVTGEPFPETAFTVDNQLAPRLGAIYDWTQEGRSKLYGHWGRYYESIPMDINVRGYGGEVINELTLPPGACPSFSEGSPVGACDEGQATSVDFLGAGEQLVTPNIGGQYLDEFGLGAEYELFANFKVGAEYKRRALGRVIEDISPDGGTTYALANPGNPVAESDLQALRDEAADLREQAQMAGSQAEANTLLGRAAFREQKAEAFETVDIFDRPERVYNAVTLRAEKRFTKSLMVKASYTYSDLKGNYPGLFSPETGQLDPNLTSMYDLPELMGNRYGDLAADAPHNLKVDGYYRHILEGVGAFTFGTSVRAVSGAPILYLGRHRVYGRQEAYLLPRAEGGRTDFRHRVDTHLSYGRELSDGMTLSVFMDVFNLYNHQPQVTIDQEYTLDAVNPIVGGDEEDLEHLKAISDLYTGTTELYFGPTSRVARENPNYGNTAARQAPFSMRFGARLTF